MTNLSSVASMASRQAFSPPRPGLSSGSVGLLGDSTTWNQQDRIFVIDDLKLSGLRERTECHVSTDPTATQSGDDSRDVLPARGAFDALASGLTKHHLFDSGESAPDIQSTNKVRAAVRRGWGYPTQPKVAATTRQDALYHPGRQQFEPVVLSAVEV